MVAIIIVAIAIMAAAVQTIPLVAVELLGKITTLDGRDNNNGWGSLSLRVDGVGASP